MNWPIASGGAVCISRTSRARAPSSGSTACAPAMTTASASAKVAEFGDHPPAVPLPDALPHPLFPRSPRGGGGPADGFQWPDFFSASATSFGM